MTKDELPRGARPTFHAPDAMALGIRRALFPGGVSAVGGPGSLFTQLTGAAAPEPLLIVVALLGSGAVATLAAVVVFRASDRRAKDRGLLDRTTGS